MPILASNALFLRLYDMILSKNTLKGAYRAIFDGCMPHPGTTSSEAINMAFVVNRFRNRFHLAVSKGLRYTMLSSDTHLRYHFIGGAMYICK